MAAPDRLLDLVERFGRNLDSYRSGRYNETEVRLEFINPLFDLLGWDIDNRQGHAEAYKDVIHEYSLKVGGGTKAPDYCFRVGGTRKFFVEAKKPSVYIREDIGPAYQLRRYAWSAKLPLSVLTDFEEFAVYDCRVKPVKTDKASKARVNYLTFDQYPDRWEEIAEVFSKDAVLKGSFDKYAAPGRHRRGTAEVDAAFLKEIESWRDALARNLALRNADLTQRELNYAVQVTIDRIIFLRICEDRGIEPYSQLMALLSGPKVYRRLVQLFHRADDRYNSGLFHFRQEQGRAQAHDELTLRLMLDDKPLKDIIRNLYYPDSPYEFSVLPADILGQVYEQFLGKVIRLTPAHRAVVEDKPEVKKAGGVYYTPTYIVDYIVKHTVGKLLEGMTPRKAAKLRILDPACGSGSFLIAAYQCLLDWHRDRYAEAGPKKHKKQLFEGPGGEWRLTTAERKRILLNNIYGVDIDPQAVETTKLSLLLKVLEGESDETLTLQYHLLHERALPDLAGNIKCGNSLIGPDFYDNQQFDLLDDEARYRINVFDWQAEFPAIMKAGGFDAVIGNPPYVNIDDTWGKGDVRQRYIKRTYWFVHTDKTDILFYFLTKALQLTRNVTSFIVSRAFLEAYKANKLRFWLSENADIREIIDFRNHYVFPGVGITTAIITLDKTKFGDRANIFQLQPKTFVPNDLTTQREHHALFQHISINQIAFGEEPWVFAGEDAQRINRKIDSSGEALARVLFIGQGMQTGRNTVFGRLDRSQIKQWGLRDEHHFLRARNSDINRYCIRDRGEVVLYLEGIKRFDELPEALRNHLKSHEAELKGRAAYKRGDCDWWRYTWPLHKKHVRKPKLYSPYLATRNRFALDEKGKYLGLTDTTVLYDASQPEQLRYIMGLLNSRLLTFRFRFIGKLKSGNIFEYFWNSVSKLPIRRIDFSNQTDKARHDRMVELVERMLGLHKHLNDAKTGHDKAVLQRQIAATDRQIDRLVYELYDLTEDEIKIVEGATAR